MIIQLIDTSLNNDGASVGGISPVTATGSVRRGAEVANPELASGSKAKLRSVPRESEQIAVTKTALQVRSLGECQC